MFLLRMIMLECNQPLYSGFCNRIVILFWMKIFLSAWMPYLFLGWVVQAIRVIWLAEYFVLLSSLPCKQLCMLSLCWQPFLICRVLVWPLSLPCKQLGVVRCLDEFSWSVECLPGSCLRRINNLVWTVVLTDFVISSVFSVAPEPLAIWNKELEGLDLNFS